MTFSYSAEVGSSAAYDGTTANSPGPIFRAVADTVDVHYVYAGKPGTIAMAAELPTPSGWRSTVPIEDAEAFTGNTHEGTVQLDLDELEAKAQAAAEETGMPSESVSITLTPQVVTAHSSEFSPALNFSLTDKQLTLLDGEVALTVTDNAVVSASGEALVTPRIVGPDDLGITAAIGRLASNVLLLVAAALGAVTYTLARRTAPLDEGESIHRRHKAILVAAHPRDIPHGQEIIDVPSFAELAKLAEGYGAKVLHTHNGVNTLTVDENTTYRYRIAGEPMEAVQQPLVGAV